MHKYFEWDENKNKINLKKHGVGFTVAKKAFFDKKRLLVVDEKHSIKEERRFCIGKIEDKIVTVRYTLRSNKIRIFGAGYWKKGTRLYETKNKIH